MATATLSVVGATGIILGGGSTGRSHRLAAGRIPACAETCKTGALRFAEINDFMAEGQRRETATVLAAAAAMSPTDADGIVAWRATGAYVATPGGVR